MAPTLQRLNASPANQIAPVARAERRTHQRGGANG